MTRVAVAVLPVLIHLMVLPCLSASEQAVIDNISLIYDWDRDHIKTFPYICQFASEEEVYRTASADYERGCLKAAKHIAQVFNGVKYIPAFKYQSANSYVLTCGADIAHGTLRNCTGGGQIIYSFCDFTCDKGFGKAKNSSLQCLMWGPKENVTAGWSVQEPCIHGGIGGVPLTILVVMAVALVIFLVIAVVMTRALCRKYRRNQDHCKEKELLPGEDIEGTTPSSSSDSSSSIQPETPSSCSSGLNEPLVVNPSRRVSDDQYGFPELSQRYDTMTHHVERENNRRNTDALDKDLEEYEKEFQIPLSTGRSDDGFPKLQVDDLGKNMFITGEQQTSLKLEAAAEGATGGQPHMENYEPVCTETPRCLLDQPGRYLRELLAELEIVGPRDRERSLIGFVEKNWEALGFASPRDLQLTEKKCRDALDQSLAEFLLQRLAHFNVKIGSLLRYLDEHHNKRAVSLILDVHVGCKYCSERKWRSASSC